MKHLPPIRAGLWRRPVRTALTMVSIASAFVLFGVLQGCLAVASAMIEARLLAIPGALIGLDLLAYDSHDVETQGVGFRAVVTASAAPTGIVTALAIGFVGGLAPAIRSATFPVAEALRAA